ncbi:MAG: hypothetical protein QOF47_3370, partial [Mycobacterium sp.]|nr:hypothetical protein [Mycobacterium sp.]
DPLRDFGVGQARRDGGGHFVNVPFLNVS